MLRAIWFAARQIAMLDCCDGIVVRKAGSVSSPAPVLTRYDALTGLQGDEPYKYDLGASDVPILRMRVKLGASARESESVTNA